jgi:hypothetical protein
MPPTLPVAIGPPASIPIWFLGNDLAAGSGNEQLRAALANDDRFARSHRAASSHPGECAAKEARSDDNRQAGSPPMEVQQQTSMDGRQITVAVVRSGLAEMHRSGELVAFLRGSYGVKPGGGCWGPGAVLVRGLWALIGIPPSLVISAGRFG